jgi:hypothetical protein
MSYKRITVKGRGRILEHRYIMEQMIGRPLEPHEHVHHKNHDVTDNRPENLAHCPTAKDHMQEHAYGEDHLLELLHWWIDEFGRLPTWKEAAEHPALPHPSTFARVFGSWRKAKQRVLNELDEINQDWEDAYA